MSLNRKNRWHFLAFRRAIRRSAPWVKVAMICITAATTFLIWRNIANLKKWRICAVYRLTCVLCWKPYQRRRTRWMLCAPAFPRSAAHCRKKRGTLYLVRGILPTNCWRHLARFFSTGITTATTANASSRKPMTTPSAVTSCICCTAKSHRKAGKRRCIFRWCCTPNTSLTPPPLPAG